MAAESYALYHELVDDEKAPLDPHVRPRFAAGRGISAQAYIDALRMRDVMKAQFAAALEGIDALLTPTTMTTALPLDEVDQAKAPDGLPTSLQIVCRASDEATALRIGWAYQLATDWHLRRPCGPRGKAGPPRFPAPR
jgi:aspartyl-tRNA(Asn)/glutamyl-tRNA(Gln) amidotransferase subunit A